MMNDRPPTCPASPASAARGALARAGGGWSVPAPRSLSRGTRARRRSGATASAGATVSAASAGTGRRGGAGAALPSRRGLLAGAGTGALTLLLAACGSGEDQPVTGRSTPTGLTTPTDTFPVSVDHAYGSTRIEAEPTRVVTFGRASQDVVIALGVVPAGVPVVGWGGDEDGASPWTTAALEALGAGWGTGAAPAQYSQAEGASVQETVQEIAALEPDLIVGVLSGMQQEDYDALSAVAPTVAPPKGVPEWGATWQDCTTLIGQALGRSEAAAALVETTTAEVEAAAAQYSVLEGATFVTAALDAAGPVVSLYTAGDNRSRFLEMLGMTMAPVAVTAGAEATETFFVPYPAQEAGRLEADLLWGWVDGEEAARAVRRDRLLSTIPALAGGTAVLVKDRLSAMSMSAMSPLSLPWACQHLLPDVAAAVEAAARGAASATPSSSPSSSPSGSPSSSPSASSLTSPGPAGEGSPSPGRGAPLPQESAAPGRGGSASPLGQSSQAL